MEFRCHLADTAGIRETTDLIEAEGVRRARQTLASADIVLLVNDSSAVPSGRNETGLRAELPDGVACIVVENKADLLSEEQLREAVVSAEDDVVWISAKTGQGMDLLRQKIRAGVGASDRSEGSFSARQRHVDALKRAEKHLADGYQAMAVSEAGELLAEELRLAQQSLGEITGELLPDDLLGEIFSSFCIGK